MHNGECIVAEFMELDKFGAISKKGYIYDYGMRPGVLTFMK